MPDSHGAIDLSAGRDRGNPHAPSFDDLSEQDKADLASLAETTGTEPGPSGQPVLAMFAVIIPREGEALGVCSIEEAAAQFYGRPATIAEMAYACRVVSEEIAMNKAAGIMQLRQMQTAAAMANHQENARIAAELAKGGNIPGMPGNIPPAFRPRG